MQRGSGQAQALTHEEEHGISDRNRPPVGHPTRPVRKDTAPRTIFRANVVAGGDKGNILPSPLFSRRTRGDRSLHALSVALARARDAGRPVLDLTVSNPTASGIDYDERGILDALALPGSLVYEPSPRGIAEARTAVASYLSEGGPA